MNCYSRRTTLKRLVRASAVSFYSMPFRHTALRALMGFAALTKLDAKASQTVAGKASNSGPSREQIVGQVLTPPRATKVPKDVSVHGDERTDPYFWLRERDNPRVVEHLKAEADYTRHWFEPLDGLVDRLYAEMLGRIQRSDESVWLRDGDWWYATQTVEGLQYGQLLRREARAGEVDVDRSKPAQILLDLNTLAQGRAFAAVGLAQWSPDGRFLAYTIDFSGSRDYELRVRNLATQDELTWKNQSVSGLAWSADSKQLWFVSQNAALRSDRLFRCAVDRPGSEELVYKEDDVLFNLDVSYSHDRRFLILTSFAKDTFEQRLIDAKRPSAKPQLIMRRRRGQEYLAMPQGDGFLVRINDHGPNFRLLFVKRSKKLNDDGLIDLKQIAQATELLAHRQHASIESFQLFRRYLVVQVREAGRVCLKVMDFQTRQWRDIDFSEPSYQASLLEPALSLGPGSELPGLNLQFASDLLRFSYTSLTTPMSVYEVDLRTMSRRIIKQQPVLGVLRPEALRAERLMAKAPDGSLIPISLVYKSSHKAQGRRPLLLIGYGSYGYPLDPRFNLPALSLLDRGVVLAIAHVRGGGDLGRAWYLQGKLDRKMNTFTDFIAVAEHLIAKQWTSAEQLIISGASAGGLLMGAAVNLRPELFRAVVAEVPFVDVINTMLDESLPLTTEEFIEWGNPKIKREYDWLRAYSPYDNLVSRNYPAMLVRAALNDSQVPFWEAAKYVARLRELKTDNNVLLFDINLHAGHGGSSGRYDALRERAKVYAFMLSQWGLN